MRQQQEEVGCGTASGQSQRAGLDGGGDVVIEGDCRERADYEET